MRTTPVPSQSLRIPTSGDENSSLKNQIILLLDKCKRIEDENETSRGELNIVRETFLPNVTLGNFRWLSNGSPSQLQKSQNLQSLQMSLVILKEDNTAYAVKTENCRKKHN